MRIEESRDRTGASNNLTRDWTHNVGDFPSFIQEYDCVKRPNILALLISLPQLGSFRSSSHPKLARNLQSVCSFGIAVRPKFLRVPDR